MVLGTRDQKLGKGIRKYGTRDQEIGTRDQPKARDQPRARDQKIRNKDQKLMKLSISDKRLGEQRTRDKGLETCF